METAIVEDKTRSAELLSPDFMRKLERLTLVSRRIFPGRLRGERRSTRRGASVEFADYRNYTVGDDFRRVDWNVYARLEKLFLKLFVEEEDLHIYVILDCSKSMDFGEPTKFLFGKRAAAALAYIAISRLDRAGLTACSGGRTSILSPKRGKGRFFEFLDWLGALQPSGGTDLAASLREFSLRTMQPGIAVVISDFLDPGYERGLLWLVSRRFEISAIHILDDEELHPTMVGDLKLVDSETGQVKEVTMSSALLRRYEHAVVGFCRGVESFCMRYGINYIRTTTSAPFEDLILMYFRRRGLLK